MALSRLTPRQEKAATLTRELQSLGANVTSVPPLEAGKQLRFWVPDYRKNELLQQLKDAGYEVVFLSMTPQVDARTYSMPWVNNFEIRLPADDKKDVPQDRTVPKDSVATPRAKTEVDKTLEAIYGKRRR